MNLKYNIRIFFIKEGIMYLYLYYIIMWAVCFILVVPVLIVGVIYVFMSNKSPKKPKSTLPIMLQIIKGAKTEQAFKTALQQFKSKYFVLPNDKDLDMWLSCIKELGVSTYWDTDAVAKFGQELEDSNPNNAKKVSIAVATALKTKEKK